MKDVGEWSLSFPLAHTLWNCASIRVPLMVAQIRLLFADISRRKINFWALPNSKISILSTFPAFSSPSLSPSFCAVLIMSRHWAQLLLVLSGLWCACLQVEKWMAVSKARLLFQAQVLSQSNVSMHFIFLSTQPRSSCLEDLELQNLTRSSFLFPTFVILFILWLLSHLTKASDSRKQDVRMHYSPHGAKSLNAPKFRVGNDKEHVYIKLVVDSLFVW